MKFNLRQVTWMFAITVGLLCTPGLARGYQSQDDHGRGQDRGQDDRHGDQRKGVPSGGYAQTCQDIRTDGTTLEARCQTRDGDWNRTSLQNFNQCTSQIENDNGRLVCTKGRDSDHRDNEYQQGDRRDSDHDFRREERRNEPPDGGYRQTCQDARVSGTTLLASCQKRNGGWRQSSLRNFNQCTSEIENNNGRLVCSR